VRELLDAWRLLNDRHPAWNLVIAGPDEDGYGQEMIHHASQLGLTAPRVRFVGPLHGPEKWAFLAAADLFVLPSHSENFGNVILESLSQETPVMTTHGTPWADLPRQGCGWWIPLDHLAPTLDAALGLGSDHLAHMGRIGRTWALGTFSWPSVGRRMLRAYEWLLNEGPAPADLEVHP
jgi:glycosyltransferase involved in cell wall biosynthesis